MTAVQVAVDHVGITVPDLDEAISFFIEVFGFDLVLSAGPYEDLGYVWPGNDGPEIASLRLSVLKLGDSFNVELLEYTNRKGSEDRSAPQPADRGGMHLAFYVDDIQGLGKTLTARSDIQTLAPLQVEQGGPLDGLIWAYFLTSFGVVIELIQWLPGLPYEAESAHRLALPPWLRPAANDHPLTAIE